MHGVGRRKRKALFAEWYANPSPYNPSKRNSKNISSQRSRLTGSSCGVPGAAGAWPGVAGVAAERAGGEASWLTEPGAGRALACGAASALRGVEGTEMELTRPCYWFKLARYHARWISHHTSHITHHPSNLTSIITHPTSHITHRTSNTPHHPSHTIHPAPHLAPSPPAPSSSSPSDLASSGVTG